MNFRDFLGSLGAPSLPKLPESDNVLLEIKAVPHLSSRYNDILRKAVGVVDPVNEELKRIVTEYEDEALDAQYTEINMSDMLKDMISDGIDLLQDDLGTSFVASNASNVLAGGVAASIENKIEHRLPEKDNRQSGSGRNSLGFNNSNVSYYQSNHDIIYPHVDMSGASVISIATKSNKLSDSFLQLLVQSYRDTRRQTSVNNTGVVHNLSKLRISLIANDGATAQALQFASEKDYWTFICRVKQIVGGNLTLSYTSKCHCQAVDKTSITSGILNMFGGTDRVSINHNVTVSGYDYSILVTDSMGKEVLGVSLDALAALAINVDYEPPSTAVLEIELAPYYCKDLSHAGNVKPVGSVLQTTSQMLRSDYLLCLINKETGAAIKSSQFANNLATISDNLIYIPLPDTTNSLGDIMDSNLSLFSQVGVLGGIKYAGQESYIERVDDIPYQSLLTSSFSLTDHGAGSDENSTTEYVDVLLKAPRASRAARVYIKSACNLLPSRKGIAPSPYCVVYLVGENGAKLTSNIAESRTFVVDKDSNPVWNREILLQDNDEGIEKATGVMIKIKDGSAGILHHVHLGQVTIPIGCFIYQTEAEFCLPLESTEKMDGVTASGEITLLTQLVNVEVVDDDHVEDQEISATPTKARPAKRFSLTASMTALLKGGMSNDSATSTFTSNSTTNKRLRRVSVSDKTMHSASIIFKVRQTNPFNVWWPFYGLFGASDNGRTQGHLLVGQSLLTIRLEPGSGGILANCNEVTTHSNAAQSNSEIVVSIPWSQVSYSTVLSESVLVIAITVRHLISSPSQIAKGELKYSLAELELLVGPCLASRLQSVLSTRVSVWNIRSQLKGLSAATLGASMERRPSVYSPLKSSHLAKKDALIVLPMARIIIGLLEDRMSTLNDPQNGLNIRTYQNLLTGYRLRVYMAHLVHLCRNLTDGPDYTVETVTTVLQSDMTVTTNSYPVADGDSSDEVRSSILNKFEFLIDSAIERVRDYVLCSYDHLRQDISAGTNLLEELISGYHNAIKYVFFPYIATKECFKRVKGNELRLFLIQFLIDNNRRYDDIIRSIISLKQWTYSSPMSIIDSKHILDIIDWYSQNIVQETRTWLGKTVQNASIFKLNAHDLPWDVETTNDDMFITSLPETLQIQLNIYMSLCKKTNLSTSCSIPASTSDSFVVSVPLPPHEEQELMKSRYAIRMNDRTVYAIGQSYMLLAEEYKRALQTKHWEQGSRDSGEIKANLQFLLATLNDCHRVTSTHVQCICDVSVSDQINISGILTSIQGAFSQVSNIALKYITRILFNDMNSIMLDFDLLWPEGSSNVNRRVCTIIDRFITDIYNTVDRQQLVRILACCAEVVVLRYLVYFRDRAESNNKLNKAETERFMSDIHDLNELFTRNNPEIVSAGSHSKSVLMQQLEYIQDIGDLLTLDTDAKAYTELLKHTLRRYSGSDYFTVGMSVLKVLVLPLRQDTTPTLIALVNKTILDVQKEAVIGSPKYLSYEREDLWIRLFDDIANRDDDTEPESNPSSNTAVTPGGKEKRKSLNMSALSVSTPSRVSKPLKYLREQASNLLEKVALPIGDKALKRKNEEYAVNIMRKLGLEDDAVKEELFDGGSSDDNMSLVSGVSELEPIDYTKSDEQDGTFCHVKITNIKVKGLRSASFMSSANPYVAISLGQQRQKTKVIWNCNEGEFVNAVILLKTSISRLANQRISVRVYDKERIRRKRLMGAVNIKLAGIDVRRIGSWYALEGGSIGNNGDIYLDLETVHV